MLAIKLSRKGRKKQPFFRVIILEKAKDPRGDFLEDLGFYNPFTKETSLKNERIKYWLSKGAQPTGSVHNLLIAQGIIKDKKVKVTKINQKKIEKKKKLAEEKNKAKMKSVKVEKEEISEQPTAKDELSDDKVSEESKEEKE
ncbi:30S ribosomal protein S16 [bacterium]|nr:30S ribosomal protein S16 [bacterium]